MKKTLNDLTKYIKKEYRKVYKDITKHKKDIKLINDIFPLDRMLNMTIEDYVTNGNYGCFINLIENRTNTFMSGFLGDNKNRVFYHSNKDNDRHIKESLMKYSEFKKYKKDVNKAFDYYLKIMYDFITTFDENNYTGHIFAKYAGNVIPCKLLLLYREDQNIGGFSSKEFAKQFTNYFGIDVDRNDDVINLNIKIRKALIACDKTIAKYKYSVVGRVVWNYASMYVFKEKYLKQDRLKDSEFIDEVNSISDKDLSKIDLDEEYRKSDRNFKRAISDSSYEFKRNAKISAESQKRAGYKCYFDSHDGKHDSFYRKNGLIYVESHHIIPIYASVAIGKNVDKLENIVCLCSECHNKLHYGKDNDKMIERLYKDKGDQLNSIFNTKLTFNKYKSLYSNRKINING